MLDYRSQVTDGTETEAQLHLVKPNSVKVVMIYVNEIWNSRLFQMFSTENYGELRGAVSLLQIRLRTQHELPPGGLLPLDHWSGLRSVWSPLFSTNSTVLDQICSILWLVANQLKNLDYETLKRLTFG